MKKILFILLAFISLNCYSQRIINMRKCRDADNHAYTTVTVANVDRTRYIVTVIFAMQYYDYNGKLGESTLLYKKTIYPLGKTDFYITRPSNAQWLTRFYIKRVIYSDGSYNTYK